MENILDTGETFENSKEYQQLLSKKISLLNLIEIKENKQVGLKDRLLLSQQKYEKLLNDLDKHSAGNNVEEKSKRINVHINELSEDLKRRENLSGKNMKFLKKRIFNLTSSLRQYKCTETELEAKFNNKNQELSVQHSNLKTMKSLENFRPSPRLDASELSPTPITSRFEKVKKLLVFS